MAKVAFHTLGCKVNQYETEAMMAQFENKGYEVTSFHEPSDVYIVNTCTVTNMADKKSRQMLARAKKNNPKSLVVAVGCYVQAAGEALNDIDHVDLLIGNTDKGRMVEVVESYLDHQLKPEVKDLSKHRVYDDLWVSMEHGHTRAHIKIQDGCDQFCSYCIIPFARGRIRSREAKSIIEEITDLTINGYQEVVLTGIHLASYGIQFENYGLIDLIEDLEKIEGLKRIRLGSLEPTLITEDFTNRISMLNKICPHFHLSLQSGNDEVLQLMNRKYTTSDYTRAVSYLRSIYPDCAITTDLIVGFPSETDEQFHSTLGFLSSIRFTDVHVFKYSMRDGTKAAQMEKQVDGSIKNKRSNEAMTLVDSMKLEFLNQFIKTEVEVLVEDLTEVEGVQYFIGHTMNYVKVYIPFSMNLGKNTFVKVEITNPFDDGVLSCLN